MRDLKRDMKRRIMESKETAFSMGMSFDKTTEFGEQQTVESKKRAVEAINDCDEFMVITVKRINDENCNIFLRSKISDPAFAMKIVEQFAKWTVRVKKYFLETMLEELKKDEK